MPRVQPLSSAILSPPIADVYERFVEFGPFKDQAAILAHVPPALDHLYQMLIELKGRGGMPWRYIELAIVVTSKLNECAFCIGSHSPVLQIEGIPDEAISTLPRADHPEFDETDRLVIEYATLVTQKAGQIRDNVFERLHAHFSESQIVELTLRVALAGFFNRFNDALQIDDGRAAAAFAAFKAQSQTQELK